MSVQNVSLNVQKQNACLDALISPYRHGARNLGAALRGKVTRIAEATLNTPTTSVTTKLSLVQRISHLVMGTLLFIPVINSIAYAILNSKNSSFIINKPTTSSSTEEGGVITPGVVVVTPGRIQVEPRQEERVYTARKNQLLECMRRIAQNPDDAIVVTPSILAFHLDQILAPYSTDHDPSQFNQMYDYATVPRNIRRELDRCTGRYDRDSRGRELVAKNTMSQIYDYMRIQRDQLQAGSEQETLFKAQIRNVFERIVDAHRNCIDQVNGQLESIVLDFMVGNIGGRDGAPQTRAQRLELRVKHALYQYRCRLLTQVCAQVDNERQQGRLRNVQTGQLLSARREHHMADFERLVKQRLADIFGDQSNLTRAGAQYGGIVADADIMVECAANRFFEERNDLGYLKSQLALHNGSLPHVRAELMGWVLEHYDLGGEEEFDAPTQAFVAAISQNPDMNAVEMGGHLKEEAVLALLSVPGILYEQAGG